MFQLHSHENNLVQRTATRTDNSVVAHIMTDAEVLVLVTGGSGFLGAHCIVKLLNEGHKVRTTIRSSEKQRAVLSALEVAGIDSVLVGNLTFAIADLSSDAGWGQAVEGCTYVLHVASPFPKGSPKDENEIIKPAVHGSLRVLKAAKKAGVKRVVLTSSFGAIGYGHSPEVTQFDEQMWTNIDGPGVSSYVKSKTLAERAAWDYAKSEEGAGLELAVVNPPGIFGPVLGRDLSSSITIIHKLLDGAMPGCPNISFGVVDVRDVAELHVILMAHEKAAGQRFIASSGAPIGIPEIALILKKRLPAASNKVSTRVLPDLLVRAMGWLSKDAGLLVPQLGRKPYASNKKAMTMMGWTPKSGEDAIVATAESLLELGIAKS